MMKFFFSPKASKPRKYVRYSNNKPKVFVAVILAVACIFLWGITFVNTKALSENFSALEILVYRFLIAYICLWIVFPKMPRLKNFREELIFVLVGFFGVTFYQFMENVAISYTYASNVSIISSTCPMLTGIMTQIFLKEKVVSKKFFAGFVLAIFGVTLVVLNGNAVFRLNPKGDLLAFVSAASWSFYSLFVNRLNALGYPGVFTTRRSFFWALVFMIPLVLLGKITGAQSLKFELNFALFKNWLNVLNISFLGLGASAFCFFAWNKACGVLGTVRTTMGLYFIPIVTVLFAAAFLGERLSAWGILGVVLVLAGLVISSGR